MYSTEHETTDNQTKSSDGEKGFREWILIERTDLTRDVVHYTLQPSSPVSTHFYR